MRRKMCLMFYQMLSLSCECHQRNSFAVKRCVSSCACVCACFCVYGFCVRCDSSIVRYTFRTSYWINVWYFDLGVCARFRCDNSLALRCIKCIDAFTISPVSLIRHIFLYTLISCLWKIFMVHNVCVCVCPWSTLHITLTCQATTERTESNTALPRSFLFLSFALCFSLSLPFRGSSSDI